MLGMSSGGEGGSGGIMPPHRIKQEDASPKRRRAKLKPDLKLKVSAFMTSD